MEEDPITTAREISPLQNKNPALTDCVLERRNII